MQSILSSKANRLFLILGGFFITNALVAEMIGSKLFSVERLLDVDLMNWTVFGESGINLTMTAGVLIWPVVFLMTDIINEYYGKKGVRFLSYLTVGLIIFAFLAIFLAINVSPDLWWQNESGLLGSGPKVEDMQSAFQKVFGQGLWIIFGSVIAFLVGQILDVSVFHAIKKRTGEKMLWLRATGSTLVSQLIDSFIVLIIAFYIGADWGLVKVLAIGSVNFIYKGLVAIILTPLLYLGHNIIDKYLGKELSDKLKQEAIKI